jgi:hypothetical protein
MDVGATVPSEHLFHEAEGELDVLSSLAWKAEQDVDVACKTMVRRNVKGLAHVVRCVAPSHRTQ